MAAASACTGNIGDSSANKPAAENVAGVEARVRRLTATEVQNSVRDVFGVDAPLDAHFPTDSAQGSFDNQFEALTFTGDFGDALQSAAEQAGRMVAENITDRVSCDPVSEGDDACAQAFVDQYGPRAYRRPLSADERARLLYLFTETRDAEDFATSIATVVEALIQSPGFVFRTELSNVNSSRARLTPYEVASELSYFLLQSPPDDELRSAADTGSIATAATLELQARRLLQDPRAKLSVHRFFLQWLEMTSTALVVKEDPASTPDLAASMLEETTRFVDDAMWSGDGGYQKLFTSSTSFVDPGVASVYGVDAPDPQGFAMVALDGSERAGFLTQPGFISTHTPGLNRSPIALGHFIRSKLFCQALPQPPPGIPPLSTDPTLDVVARFSQHESDPSCSGCHSQMDPIGFGFSQYDVLGRFNPTDHGVNEDGAGTLENTDVDGTFHGPVELSQRLAKSKVVQQCVAGTLMQFALGRAISSEAIDQNAVASALAGGFGERGNLEELFISIVKSDAFVLRDTTAVPVTTPGAGAKGNP